MKMKKKIAVVVGVLILSVALVLTCAGCRKADRVAWNVSKEADNFNVTRKLTVMNVRTDTIIMEMTGTFAIANNIANELEVICQTGENEYKKHFVYLNDWTVYTVEDISGAEVSAYQYELTFYPRMIPITNTDVEWR